MEQKQVEGYISASTFSDIYYIVRKARGKDWTLDFLSWIVNVTLLGVNDEAVRIGSMSLLRLSQKLSF